MLRFHRITELSDPHFVKVTELYEEAFPEAERRTYAAFERELLTEPRFNVQALLKQEDFLGFFNFWKFNTFFYIEHFAINSSLRSQYFGSEAIEIFKSMCDKPIVLEVEMPNDTDASRRIHFYEQLGFSVLNNDYAQPPYDGNGFVIPMLIMSNKPDRVKEMFEEIRETLYTEVYKFSH